MSKTDTLLCENLVQNNVQIMYVLSLVGSTGFHKLNQTFKEDVKWSQKKLPFTRLTQVYGESLKMQKKSPF